MSENEGDLVVLECHKCAAFFIDEKDFQKHKMAHNVALVDYEIETVDCDEAPARSRKRKLTQSEESTGWQTHGRQKLTLKLVKKGSKSAKSSDESLDDSARRRRSLRVGHRDETPKKVVSLEMVKKVGSIQRSKELRKSSVELVGDVVTREVGKEKSKKLKIVEVGEMSQSVSGTDAEIAPNGTTAKTPRPRLKRLRRKTDDNEDKSQIIYVCAHCLRNFRRKSNLKRHMSKLHFGQEKAEGADSSTWFTGYCCDICGEGLQMRSTMMVHRDVLHSKEPEIDWCKYQTSLARVRFCGDCKRYFRAGKLFDEHQCDLGTGVGGVETAQLLRQAEDVKPSFFCPVCNSCFRWKWDYRLHRENEHKDAAPVDWSQVRAAVLDFCCEKCSKAYFSAEELNEHDCSATAALNAANSMVKPFRCDLCGNDYFWKSDFRRHMRLKHPKENFRPTEHDTIIYSCPYCEEKFSMKKRILHHMRKEHSVNADSPFVCVRCNKVFRRRDNLDRHNESYHPAVNDTEEANTILREAEIRINGDVAYRCRICNRNISNPNRFISHYRGHNSENKFTCDLCGKQAKTQHQLNTHIKNIHLNIRNYKCDICDKCFYTKQACEEHRRIHTGERPFSCEICGKTFVAGNALISHKRFHNDFYPHSCHMCPKKFKVRRSLINHIRTHTGERPFKCDICSKTFNNSSQFSYHKKVTHSDARPFTCSLCGNCFKANKFLSRHMELHAAQSHVQSRKAKKTRRAKSQIKENSVECGESVQHGIGQLDPTISSMDPLPPPTQSTTVPMTIYIKDSDDVSAYRNDDIASALYSLQRGYEPTPGEYRPVECDMNAMTMVKRPLTAAEAYVAAADYALNPNEEYKTDDPSRMYTTNQPTTQPIPTSGKHMAWL